MQLEELVFEGKAGRGVARGDAQFAIDGAQVGIDSARTDDQSLGDLAVAMVRTHLRFRPAWEQEQLAERHEMLVLYDAFCTTHKQLLLVLLGLNRLYFPGWRWLDRLLDQMYVNPPSLSMRLKQLFAIVSIDLLASVYHLHDLIEETFVLGRDPPRCGRYQAGVSTFSPATKALLTRPRWTRVGDAQE